jgi:predicted DNA-binding transcriptional regulator AlpA
VRDAESIDATGVERAAAYVGFGTTKFLEMVNEGTMPKPIMISGDNPRWDRLDLDAAFDNLKDDPSEVGRKRAEEFHRARQARLAKDKG